MAVRQYVGARYVPVFADPVQWSDTRTYEPLTMVQNAGETYMSRQHVPAGIQLPSVSTGEESNDYWVHMSNWNAQVEGYREEVLRYAEQVLGFDGRIEANSDAISDFNQELGQYEDTTNGRLDAIEADAWVSNNRIAANAVTTEKIANDAVTMEKIQDDWVFKPNNGLMGIFRSTRNNEHYLVYSQNGEDFRAIAKTSTNLTSDASSMSIIGNWFYYTGNRGFWAKSKDLVNWEDGEIEQPSNVYNGWAGMLFDDPYTNKLYHVIAHQVNTVSYTNAVGSTPAGKFVISICEIEQLENGDLNKVTEYTTLLESANYSYIDGYLIYSEVYGYVLAVKNETTCQIEIYNGSTMHNLTLVNQTDYLIGVEAPKLIEDNCHNLFIYCDCYDGRTVSYLNNPDISNLSINRMQKMFLKCCIAVGYNQAGQSSANWFVSRRYWDGVRITQPNSFRHVGVCKCNAKAKAICESYGTGLLDMWNITPNYHNYTVSFPTTDQIPIDSVVYAHDMPINLVNQYRFIFSGTPQQIVMNFVKIFKESSPTFFYGGSANTTLKNVVIKTGSYVNSDAGNTNFKLDMDFVKDRLCAPVSYLNNAILFPQIAI